MVVSPHVFVVYVERDTCSTAMLACVLVALYYGILKSPREPCSVLLCSVGARDTSTTVSVA